MVRELNRLVSQQRRPLPSALYFTKGYKGECIHAGLGFNTSSAEMRHAAHGVRITPRFRDNWAVLEYIGAFSESELIMRLKVHF